MRLRRKVEILSAKETEYEGKKYPKVTFQDTESTEVFQDIALARGFDIQKVKLKEEIYVELEITKSSKGYLRLELIPAAIKAIP